MTYLTKEDVDGIIDTIRIEHVGGLATNDLEELHALALKGLVAPEAEAPVAWAVRNIGGALHSLTLTRETAEHNAKSLKQTVVPLYLQPGPQND